MGGNDHTSHEAYGQRFEVVFTKGAKTIGLFVARSWLEDALRTHGLPVARELSDQDFSQHVFRCCETSTMVADAIARRNKRWPELRQVGHRRALRRRRCVADRCNSPGAAGNR